MPHPATTIDDAKAPAEVIRSEPTVDMVRTDDDVDAVTAAARGIVIRHVVERQLAAGQDLSTQLVDAATDVTAAVAHAPASVIDEIRGGTTLPTAFTRTGTSVRDVVTDAGDWVRNAVGRYVGNQATLPNAVIVGAAGVAETIARALGTVTASALSTAFTLATVASQSGDVREAFGLQRRDLRSTATEARDRIGESVRSARDEIRGSIVDYDVLIDAFA